jgi:HD-GYP domain-containing protein (c-di-GMP phosphodiesterase class II)
VLRRAALLHDVGKLGVDDAIIHSPSKLTDEEQKKIHDHPTIGIELIASLSFLADTLGPIESHHERFDGTGYPGKLAREQIPLEARIIAIADTFDALTTDRPYQKALTTAAALNEMSSSADSGQLDPELVSKFVEIMREEVSRSTEPDPIE